MLTRGLQRGKGTEAVLQRSPPAWSESSGARRRQTDQQRPFTKAHAGSIPTRGDRRGLAISGWLTGIYFVIELGISLRTGLMAVTSDACPSPSAVGGALVAPGGTAAGRGQRIHSTDVRLGAGGDSRHAVRRAVRASDGGLRGADGRNATLVADRTANPADAGGIATKLVALVDPPWKRQRGC